jgi:HSP20 family molecular chaperone IbpA
MLFRNADLLAEFERLTKGLHPGPEFDKAVGDLSTALTPSFAGSSSLDVVRSDDRVEFYVDLPGVDPEQVDLTIDGRTLNISAQRDFTPTEGQTLVHAGRRHGTYNRSFKLSEDLDVDQLSARSEHGVLIVNIPVIAAVQPRKIAIER